MIPAKKILLEAVIVSTLSLGVGMYVMHPHFMPWWAYPLIWGLVVWFYYKSRAKDALQEYWNERIQRSIAEHDHN